MKFIYDGDYTVKDGVTFMFRNPTTVENKVTIEKLLKDPAFRVAEELPSAEIIAECKRLLEEDVCPKCGRVIKRGRFMHIKHCKGSK